MKKINPFLLLLIIGILFSCSRTKNIQISKKEIKALKVIYHKKTNYKFSDAEWKFYEKNICQFSISFVTKETFTGTWTQRQDTIIASFFYNKKELAETWKFLLDENKNLKIIN